MGPHLGNNLINLGIYETARTAVAELGLDLEELLAHEDEPGLGNGGLGRLAACFIDSLATLEVPALGYGIRYEFGIFQQEIVDGWQVEKTDKWLRYGNPWEIARPEWCCDVKFGGHTEVWYDEFTRKRTRWVPGRIVNRHSLRHADPGLSREHGEHAAAVEGRSARVLRLRHFQSRRLLRRGQPEGGQREPHQGPVSQRRPGSRQGAAPRAAVFLRELLAAGHAAHLQGAEDSAGTLPREVRRAAQRHASVDRGGRAHAPAGRRNGAWTGSAPGASRARPSATPITRCCPKRWSAGRCGMFGRLLPRLLEIIYEINARFLDEVRMAFFGDEERIKRLSLIDEAGETLRAHGASGERRQSRHQRRRRAAFGLAEERCAARTSRSSGRRSSPTRPTA